MFGDNTSLSHSFVAVTNYPPFPPSVNFRRGKILNFLWKNGKKKWKNGRKNGKKSGRMEEKYKFQKLIN